MHPVEVGEIAASEQAAARLFAGSGELRARCRALDWAATPLGPVAGWPAALRTAAGLVLAAPTAMIVLWGPDLVQVYNDGYREVIGAKHPAGLGQPTRDCWPEVWAFNAPLYAGVVARRETFTFTDQRLVVERHGHPEEAFFTLTFSPVPDDADGPNGPSVGGVLVTVFETTARVRARGARAVEREQLLAESEAARAQVTATLESIGDAFYAVDAEFRFTYVNRKTEELWGRPRESLLGRHYWTEFPQAVDTKPYRRHLAAMAERRPAHFETFSPIIGRWLDVSLYPDEATGGLACYFRDVTERRAAEAALAASELRFRAVQDASPLGFAIQRPVYAGAGGAVVDFTLSYVNEAGAHIGGRTREEMLAGTLLGIWPATVDEGVFADYVRVLETGEPGYRELLYEHDGLAAGLAITTVRVGDGPEAELGITFNGITARLRAEREHARLLAELGAERERLRSLILHMPAPLALLEGPEHRFVLVNDAYRVVSGPRPDVVGRTLREAFPELAGQGLYERFDAVAATGVPWVAPETLVRYDRDGTGVQDTWWDLRVEPVRDAGADGASAGGVPGRVVALLAYNVDVTAQVRARRDVERLLRESEAARREAEAARAAADAANQAKSEFLAVMSHEIRTPINAITGYAQLLELEVAGPVTPMQRDYLGRLTTASAHLLGLVNDVLDLSKIDAGEFSVARAPAAAGVAVAAALDLVRPQGGARGVRLAADVPAGVTYVGDAHRVRQILVNLLSNAVKFTAPGGTVTVAGALVEDVPPAARLAGAGPWARVRVEDTGIGIAPAEQAAVFEPFHQVEQGHTRTRGGTGLGLAISQRLARLMGGDLTLESTPGVGSVFTLWLPAVDATADGTGADESAPARVARAAHAEPDMVRGLGELGALLRRQIDTVVAAYADRLRAEPAAPLARGMRQAELEDHLVTALADFAQSLVIVGEAEAAAAGLLADSVAINQAVAERHGVRRFAQGWDEAALRADYAVLREVLARVIRADARARGSSAGGADVEAALAILLGLVEQSEARALAAWRVAHTADGRSAGGRAAL